MTRLILLGLVTIAMVIIAPLIGASRSVSVDPDSPSSWLSGRPIIPELPEESGGDQVEPSDRRGDEEWRDRRNRDEEWHDRQRDREEWWDDEDRQRDREEARDFFEEIFN